MNIVVSHIAWSSDLASLPTENHMLRCGHLGQRWVSSSGLSLCHPTLRRDRRIVLSCANVGYAGSWIRLLIWRFGRDECRRLAYRSVIRPCIMIGGESYLAQLSPMMGAGFVWRYGGSEVRNTARTLPLAEAWTQRRPILFRSWWKERSVGQWGADLVGDFSSTTHCYTGRCWP